LNNYCGIKSNRIVQFLSVLQTHEKLQTWLISSRRIIMETVSQISKKLRSGKLDPVDLTEQILQNIKASDDQAIFIDVFEAHAITEAKASRRRLKAGNPLSILDGVPIGWKDLFDIEGRTTTAGSVVLKSNPPAKMDAGLVDEGKRAGMVAIGATSMNEFAYSGIGINPHYGTPRNPHDKKLHRSPGGSSSGSAVAVASGLLPVAIGTDTGGSIRVPAAFNGIVGYKSSTGHYEMNGVFPLSRTLDSLGPLAQTVEDCVMVDRVLRGSNKAITKRDVRGMEFVVPTNIMFDGIDEAVQINFESALKRITRAGGKIKRKPFPVFEKFFELLKTRGNVLGPEALQLHWNRVYGPDAARMDPRVVKRIKTAENMTAVDLVEVLLQRKALIEECNNEIGTAIVICPTAPHVAMDIKPLENDMDLFFAANAKTLRNTMIGNFFDWCGLAIPSGINEDGMPTSVLLSAPHGQDARMLGSGLALENLIRPS
jgi:aspartyl-tRNA(Asn)/glutamyl-tRNA(Gln) amidotransferase subunit A